MAAYWLYKGAYLELTECEKKRGRNSLHVAATTQYIRGGRKAFIQGGEMCEWLLQNGSDLTALDKVGVSVTI